MSARQFATQLKALIEDIKSKGTAAIYCDNLIDYLAQVANSPDAELSPAEFEQYKANLKNWVEANKSAHEGHLEMFRSVITAGQSAIRSSFLLNGGAAIALLAFIGHLARFDVAKVPEFATCLSLFAFGVLAITITSGATYLSQWFYASDHDWCKKLGFGLNLLCIALGISSYGMFIWGLVRASSIFAAYH